jgi:putative transposase
MPEYRRSRIAGGIFFFTVVTYYRLPIQTTIEARKLLRPAWEDVQGRFPFTIDSVCLLPEHLHTIWIMPDGDANYSLRWKEIKRLFTRGYLEQVGPGENRNDSRKSRGEAAIWQRRFWEHTIRDQEDLNHHRDYLHYNPVKQGLVKSVADWPWSSFHRYLRRGYYEAGGARWLRNSLMEWIAGNRLHKMVHLRRTLVLHRDGDGIGQHIEYPQIGQMNSRKHSRAHFLPGAPRYRAVLCR